MNSKTNREHEQGKGKRRESNEITQKFLQLQLESENTIRKQQFKPSYMNSNTQKQLKFGTQIRNPNSKT